MRYCERVAAPGGRSCTRRSVTKRPRLRRCSDARAPLCSGVDAAAEAHAATASRRSESIVTRMVGRTVRAMLVTGGTVCATTRSRVLSSSGETVKR